MRFGCPLDATNVHGRWSGDGSTWRAQTPCTTARAHHVHRDVHGLYMALRAVVHRNRPTARESLEVVLPMKLTSHNDDSHVGSAGLRNPAQSPNPALTRCRNTNSDRMLHRRAGLPG